MSLFVEPMKLVLLLLLVPNRKGRQVTSQVTSRRSLVEEMKLHAAFYW